MNNYIDRQSGAVLVMSLVLLTVLTLIGVASMSSSSLDMRAASNAQQRNIAFEAGQSIAEIAASMNDPKNTNDYQGFIIGVPQIINYLPADMPISATASTLWENCSKGVGSSLEEGKGLVKNGFSVRSTSMPLSGSSTSVQVQGVRFPAAACK